MKIIVCIKGIAVSEINKSDSDEEYKIGTKDMYALKTALVLKEKYRSEIVVICMAPLSLINVLKNLYIYDINKIYLANDNLFVGADTFVTSLVLSKMIDKIGMADVILCGKCSDDSGTAQIGPSLAERMSCQLIRNLSAIEVNGQNIKCECGLKNKKQVIETKFPLVSTIEHPPTINKYPSLRNILNKKNDIIIFNADDLGLSKNQIQSKTKVLKLFSYEKEEYGELIQGSISEKITKLMNIIRLYGD